MIHQDGLVIDVEQDDRIGHAPQDQVEPVALTANLLLGGLQEVHVLRHLLVGLAQVRDVGQHGDGAARAVEVVGRGQRAHLEQQLGAFDRIDQRQVMRGPTGGILFELAGAQGRGK